MKTNIISILFGALLTFGVITSAVAGPGPQLIFTPVKTMKQAERIKPGETIAFSCGNCGSVSVTVADKDRSYLRGYTCNMCKKKFVLRDNAHGQAQGSFIYEDDEKHFATLLQKH
jgi:predicted RNA-binding Zn-ribbon protein involved in translation (DUF1610 family)